MVGLWDI